MIRIGVAVERHAGGGQTVRALSFLPALVGAWRNPAAGSCSCRCGRSRSTGARSCTRSCSRPGKRVVNQFLLGEALTGGLALDPPIKALMVYNSNPVVVCPDQEKLIDGLQREDLFTVVSEQFMTDTAEYADIVLPATTQLEQDDIMFSWGHLYVTYNQRAIDAARRGRAEHGAVPAAGRADGLRRPGVPAHGRGDDRRGLRLVAPAHGGHHRRVAQGAGLAAAERAARGRVRAARGGRLPHAVRQGRVRRPRPRPAGTSSSRCSARGPTTTSPGSPVDPLPHYIPPRESARTNPELAARYPLNLLTPKSHAYMNSSCANQTMQRQVQKEPNVIIHPDDAAERGIADGEPVRVFNERGEFTVQAKLDKAVLPGVVVSSLGGWRKHSQGGRDAGGGELHRFADLGNAPTFSDTLVQVEQA